MSMDLAFVRRPKQRVNIIVNTATIASLVTMRWTMYRALIAATGNSEEKHIVTKDATRRSPSCE